MTAWFVILGYSLQLYFDFSAYCDIAAGCARLLGLRLPVNFDSPYRSLSVTEFWKRWHMTLTAFLRECVYFRWAAAAGSRADVSEHSGGVSHQRHLAWGRRGHLSSGDCSTARRRSQSAVGRQAGRAAEMAPLGHDVFLPGTLRGCFSGHGYIGGGSAAEKRCDWGLLAGFVHGL